MRRPDFYRTLNAKEVELAKAVFDNTLPPFMQIGIGNGLGMGNRPWTDSGSTPYQQIPAMKFQMNIGDYASADLTSTGIWYDTESTLADLLIHELTHVWQYHHGFGVWVSSLMASAKEMAKDGWGYGFKPGGSWDSYGVEQQATIVEKWNHRGRSKDDELYPYIRLVVRTRGQIHARSLSLEDLTRDVKDLRRRGLD